MKRLFEIILFVMIVLVAGFLVGFSNKKSDLYENMVNAAVVIHNGSGWGSGVFIEDNVILTAAHALEDFDSFSLVELADGTELKINDFYQDKKEDIGFIFVDAKELHIAKISRLHNDIGDIVYSVGAPNRVDFKFTLSRGILSHLDRDFWHWEDLFQADILSGPGSSGSPLYDSKGRVIGIVVANPCPYRSGNITLCESGKSILEAYQRCKDAKN